MTDSNALAAARAATPRFSDEDFATVVDVAKKHRMTPIDLGLVLWRESEWNTRATNPLSGATGLIQWMPGNAPGGYSNDRVRAMTFVEQMRLVDAWLARWAPTIGNRPWSSAGLVYATVFAPGRLSPSANEQTELFRRPPGDPPKTNEERRKWAYWANEALDTDRDGVIRIGDLTANLLRLRTHDRRWAPMEIRLVAAGGGSPAGGRKLKGPAIVGGLFALAFGAAYITRGA